MPEVETDVEGVETEVNSYREEEKTFDNYSSCSGNCRDDLQEILEQLETNCEEVAIFIQTGSSCCAQTGCICEVNECFVTLLDHENPCNRTYILLDCICAVKSCVDASFCETDYCEE